MPDLFVGSRNPLFYDFLRVLAPFVEPFLQRRYGRRQDENTDRFREKPSDLMGALPVDFQNGVITFIQLVQYCDTGSPVKVSVNFCMFKKLAFFQAFFEIIHGREMVFAAVLLYRTRLPGGMRYGQAQAGICLNQCGKKRRFTGSGWSGYCNQGTA